VFEENIQIVSLFSFCIINIYFTVSCVTMSGFEFTPFIWAFTAAAAMFLSRDPEQGQLIVPNRAELSPKALTLHNSSLRECEHCADEEGLEVQFGHGRVYQTDEH
jgi:hypothetical protein